MFAGRTKLMLAVYVISDPLDNTSVQQVVTALQSALLNPAYRNTVSPPAHLHIAYTLVWNEMSENSLWNL